MAGDWQHWLSEGWKVATGTGVGFVIGKLTELGKWRKERIAAKEKAKSDATLREYAQLQAETYRDLLKQREEFAGSVTSVTVTIEARAALEAAVKAFRQIGDDMTALELEKTARGWELSHALPPAPDPREQQRRDEVTAKLLQRAKEQEALHRHFCEKVRAAGGVNTKNRLGYVTMAADAARAAADAYREAGDVVQALVWEQKARNTVP